jgi:hypothetical protein
MRAGSSPRLRIRIPGIGCGGSWSLYFQRDHSGGLFRHHCRFEGALPPEKSSIGRKLAIVTVNGWIKRRRHSSLSPIASYSQLEERTPQPLLNRMV